MSLTIPRDFFEPSDFFWVCFISFSSHSFVQTEESFRPRVDIHEQEGKTIIRAEIPGMKKEDIKVHVLPGAIELSGEKEERREEKGLLRSFCSIDLCKESSGTE
eukprot:TRINITY_DN17160_c0_g1_i1.p1 TRINITY_DN17160_c0_g1~~TRINITY_DN17160_c0_g1_i1.p1  ORF type:complete len:104 (-),score=26.10 TRINITY_DN17160_c0_g1_i1:228-539(-)